MRTKPTAHDVAMELRKLADGLDKEPGADVGSATVFFFCSYLPNPVMAMRAISDALPRPILRKFEGDSFVVSHDGDAVNVTARVNASIIGKLVTPATQAVYEYDPSVLGLKDE